MIHLSFPLKLLLAIFLGAIIGIEREPVRKKEFSQEKVSAGGLGGLRTFSLISLFGAISGYLSISGNITLFLITAIAFFALILAYYVVGGVLTKSVGLTTELAALYSFLIGFFVVTEIFPVQLVIALTIVLTLILSLKEKTQRLTLGINQEEINGFLSFAIIALVVLPFLPNQAYYLTDIPAVKTILSAYHVQLGLLETLEIVNPFRLWFIVALITGIDVFGYLLGKLAGPKRGKLVTSLIGGFISSTSTTISLAQQSKKESRTDQLVALAVFANLMSFLQIFILVAPLNSGWLVYITSTLFVIAISAFIVGLFYYSFARKQPNESVPEAEGQLAGVKLFSFKPALRFALILVLVKIVTKASLAFFGQAGFLLSSIIASFTGIDAIVINLAESAGASITYEMALLTLVAVNASNLLSKTFYSFIQGSRKFTLKLLLAVLIVISVSFVFFFLV
ncbi:MAG: DUF4010 domain-containing protein [bacterium]|nr:DUF4010 domain-containing protein [bacterium]